MDAPTIDGDVRCRSCGYNLRGLQSAGKCPECAADVAISLQPVGILTDQRSRNFAEIGLWLVILVVGWQILFKLALILSAMGMVSAAQQAAFDIEKPILLATILFAEAFATFFFSTRFSTRLHKMIFVCLLALAGMSLLIGFGRVPARGVDVFLVTGLPIPLIAIWLNEAFAIAAISPTQTLAERMTLLKWTLPLLLALGFIIQILPRSDAMTYAGVVCDGAVIALSAWMIFLLTRLNGLLQKLPAPSGTSSPQTLPPPPPPPNLLANGPLWNKWVAAGLAMECLWLTWMFVISASAFLGAWLESSRARYIYMSTAWSPSDPTAAIIHRFLNWASQAVFIFWMTTPLPEELNPTESKSESFNYRLWLRFFAVALGVGQMTSLIYGLNSEGPSELVRWIVLAMGVCEVFCFFAFIEKDLASLLGDDEIRQWARVLKWLTPCIGVVATELLYQLDIWGGLDRLRYYDLEGARQLVDFSTAISAIWLVFTCWRIVRRASLASAPSADANVI